MKSLKSFCWIPRFHAYTLGGSKSYTVGFIDTTAGGSPLADERSCSRPHSRRDTSTPGALAIMSNTMLPCGRS